MDSDSRIPRSIYLQWLLALLLPRLREWPVGEWHRILDKAVVKPFDRFEHAGIIAAILFVTWLLKPEVSCEVSIIAIYAKSLLLSMPCFVLLAGPLFLRRFRRGIAVLADERKAPRRSPPM